MYVVSVEINQLPGSSMSKNFKSSSFGLTQ